MDSTVFDELLMRANCVQTTKLKRPQSLDAFVFIMSEWQD